ncbi:hypothetical protein ABW19_dt0207843 [Dactylella cylindrospora]|nr:hypothetical protein ABW19_dt0207843 [Dactylella cylindrospora]
MHFFHILLSFPFLLSQPLALAAAWRYQSIYSIHTERVPICPPNYSADADYIGCCYGNFETITSAPGPDGSMSSACCYQDETCTGAPPVMYDWTTDHLGYLVDVIPTSSKTTQAPELTPTAGEPTSTAPDPGQTSATAGETSTENSEEPEATGGTGSSIVCNGDQCNIINGPGDGPIGQSNTSGAKKLSGGEIAGIAVGVVSAIATIVSAWYAKRQYDHDRLHIPGWLASIVRKPSSEHPGVERNYDVSHQISGKTERPLGYSYHDRVEPSC